MQNGILLYVNININLTYDQLIIYTYIYMQGIWLYHMGMPK